MFLGPNTNMNTIRVQKFGRTRIQILFGSRDLSEYEYYSECQFCTNTNTQIIRILPNTNTKNTEDEYKNH